MPIRRTIAALALATVVTAASGRAPRYSASTGESAVYACADGRSVEVLYAGGDAVVVSLAGRPVQMVRAAAADGERYVGAGWQWWGRGARDGRLSRLSAGEDIASDTGVACRAR